MPHEDELAATTDCVVHVRQESHAKRPGRSAHGSNVPLLLHHDHPCQDEDGDLQRLIDNEGHCQVLQCDGASLWNRTIFL